MASEWRTRRLGDLVEIYDGPHATPPKTTTGPIFLGISNLKNGRLDLSATEHLSEDDFIRWTRRVTPRCGDVVFSYETRLGEAALIPEGLRCCLGRRMGLLRPKDDAVDSRFLLYAYLGDEFQETLRQRTVHGSTVDRIPLIDMPGFPIRIPDVDEQRAVARILGALDDKIEVNRQMSQALEQMAAALFTSWFVDFDPVRAKVEGRQPERMDAETAALFPDRFVESEIGGIPEGWVVGPILQHAQLLSGGTPKTNRSEYWGGNILWASAKDVSQCGDTFLIDTERKITERGVQESSTRVIPVFSSVVVARGATTGRLVLFGRAMAMNQTCYALESRVGTPFALYCQLRRETDNLVHSAHGSVFDTITTRTFATSKVVLPPKAVLLAFETMVDPVFHRILVAIEESNALAELRDTLLPRLLSGEISVPLDIPDGEELKMPIPRKEVLLQSCF